MFMHGYQSYMTYAYPADELMPLSCRGRVRGVTPSRGDVDDSLGNFSLTLIDTLDTLVVVGALDEFERAVKLIVDNVRFDSDLIVSVFETNIRILGGLLSGHLMAELIRGKDPSRLQWYNNGQLLKMAIDIGDRLLPAFNTSSGIPYSRARKAMDFLWGQRHRASDLMGTVLNVHSGDWVRRGKGIVSYLESGIGAGIDSYYEYCLKAYILLGDKSFLERFERVLKGDVKRAIEMHEMLFQVVQVMDSINDYVRVPCGFAGVKDVRTMSHEDRMDSFVLSETFKYLYMIFAEPSELIFDPDNYVLTTEAHFLPLNIGNEQSEVPRRMLIHPDDISLSSKEFYVYANPPGANQYPTEAGEALRIRERTQGVLEELFDMQRQQQSSQQPLQCVKPLLVLKWRNAASISCKRCCNSPHKEKAKVRSVVSATFKSCPHRTSDIQCSVRLQLIERSDCMFQEKSRQAQQAGAIGVIVIDHIIGTSSANEPSFAMAEDKDSPDDIVIPSLFVYYKEGQQLLKAARSGSKVVMRLSSAPLLPDSLVEQYLMSGMSPAVEDNMMCLISEGDFIQIDNEIPSVIFNFRFESVTQDSEPHVHQEIVERHVTNLQDAVGFNHPGQRAAFFNLMRTAAYGALGLNVQDENLKTVEQALRDAYLLHLPPTIHENLRGDITQVRCLPRAEKVQCVRIAA
ncbi:PA domain protein [Teladorsagia circumcincta]|uniref:alpha-1,2-Mannosidase n=1 Tax=Teladorsagia circumcincta TaxID=45464 RepID=A0A2G9UG70_TELCI|nr:PA domain protein [Teladorsagia circumcincta]